MEKEAVVSAEVRELLTNYRNSRRRSYEPCRSDNLVECLVGLHEELSLLNIRCLMNPHTEVGDGTLSPAALVSLVNAVYSLLHEHKRLAETVDLLGESKHALEKNNAALNTKIERLSCQVAQSERDARASVAEGLRAAERTVQAGEELRTCRARVAQLTARLKAAEHALRVTSSRAEKDNQQLKDKFRDKCGTFLSTSNSHGNTPSVLDKENAHDTIRKLHKHNERLLGEVFGLKQDLLLQTLGDLDIQQ